MTIVLLSIDDAVRKLSEARMRAWQYGISAMWKIAPSLRQA
jgi:hypothetical protein